MSWEKENWKMPESIWNWNQIETEIDLIEMNLGQSIAEILSNYQRCRANFQEKSRFTFQLATDYLELPYRPRHPTIVVVTTELKHI